MDLDELYRLLRGSHVRAQGVVDTIRDPLLILSADLTVLSANPAFYEMFETHREETVDVPFYDLGNGQWDIDELRLLLEQVIPKTTSIFDYEVTATFPKVGHRTMLVSAQRLKHPDNGQRVLLISMSDATERQQKDDAKDILIGELDHRIKNLLAVTRALARQTKVEGRSAEEYRDIFLGRFEALGRSMEVSSDGSAPDVAKLVQGVVSPYLEGPWVISVAEAPQVSLLANQTTSLGMILHELSTNATKYGALSVQEGSVAVDWDLTYDDDQTSWLHLRWKERGGPETTPPDLNGFGTRLIQFAAERELNGNVELDYQRDGLIATVSFPR